MPFPRTWSEELAAEYLQLEGYIVETGHPVQIEQQGGRREIDVLGFKVEKGKLKILQLEIGTLSEGKEKNYEKIKRKFSDIVAKEIERIAEKNFPGLKYEWIKQYVVVPCPSEIDQELKEKLERENIKVLSMDEFYEQVKQKIKKWKENNRTKKNIKPTLPNNLWMLKLIEAHEKLFYP